MIQYVAIHKNREVLAVVSYNIAYNSHRQLPYGFILAFNGLDYMHFESFFIYYRLGNFLLYGKCKLKQRFVRKFLIADNKRKQPSIGYLVIIYVINQNPQLSWIFADNIQNLLLFADYLVACCDHSHLSDIAGIGRQKLRQFFLEFFYYALEVLEILLVDACQNPQGLVYHVTLELHSVWVFCLEHRLALPAIE